MFASGASAGIFLMGTLEAHEFQAGGRIRLDASLGLFRLRPEPLAASRPFGFDPLRREMCPENSGRGMEPHAFTAL